MQEIDIDSVQVVDTVTTDSVQVDSATLVPAIAVQAPNPDVAPGEAAESLSTTPWVVIALLLFFTLLSVRFKNNFRFISAMLGDLLNVRHRNNMFDDTLRETSFLIALDILCIAEVSILAVSVISRCFPAVVMMPVSETLLWCLLAVSGLYVFQTLAYCTVGWIFSDAATMRLWVRSFFISQGLLAILLFPVALSIIFNPGCAGWMIWVGVACFLTARISFIYKGFKIFFTQISSWVLFLYYLCSMEVVPFIITAACIQELCT